MLGLVSQAAKTLTSWAMLVSRDSLAAISIIGH